METIIVSMCTYKYNDWIIYFYNGIRKYNPDMRIIIYLINYPPEHANLLRCFFSDVTFIEKKGNFKLKPTYNEMKEKECVTYLKGTFVRETIALTNKPVMWVDITALIRTDLSEINDLLLKNDIILNRRDFTKDEGTKVIAAEIFGIRDYKLAQFYEKECLKDVTNWYQDQTSLATLLRVKDINIDYIKFGEYSNFHFESNAKSWSDRGRTGNGTFNKDDKDYNFEMYYKDLKSDYFDKELDLFNDLFNENKPNIMCYIDEDRWCYYTTAMKLCKYLSKNFYISIVRNVYVDRNIVDNFNGDLVWARCSSQRLKPLLNIRPDLKDKFISTMTTGGELLDSRVELHIKNASESKYILTQNYESYKKLLETNQKPILIPNGVELNRFKPVTRDPTKRFIVGFAGRHNTSLTDIQKGYTEYFVTPCKELSLETKEGNSGVGFIPHSYMYKFYNDIDVLIQVSCSEGCSNTIMEAMSSGIPCIISRVGYHGENCEDNHNVLFVDRDKEQVKEALIKLKDKEFYDKISKNARDFAENHSWEIMADKFKETFQQILKNEIK